MLYLKQSWIWIKSMKYYSNVKKTIITWNVTKFCKISVSLHLVALVSDQLYCNLFLQRVASKRFLQSDWLQQRSITFINTFLLPRESMQIQYNTADTRRNHWWFKSLTFHTNSSTKPTLCVNSFFACSFLANSAFVRVRDLSSSFISSFLFCRSSACAPRVSDNSENMRRKGIGN